MRSIEAHGTNLAEMPLKLFAVRKYEVLGYITVKKWEAVESLFENDNSCLHGSLRMC